jgi:hypothetical protein
MSARTSDTNSQDPKAELLGGRFKIDTTTRLTNMDSPCAEAYAAGDQEDQRRHCVGLITRAEIPSRSAAASGLHRINSANILNVLAWGAIPYGQSNARRMAFVIERPPGPRLMTGSGEGKPFPESIVIKHMLPGLLSGLEELHEGGIFHRAIRPSNIFLDEKRGSSVLGECVTTPPGFDQPTSFEPLERAMAQPDGRGTGTPACDMYALGMTVVALLSGQIQAEGDPADEISKRIEQGSLATFTDGLRCSDSTWELLAGLLFDEAKHRWSIADVRSWTAGRRLSPPVMRNRSGVRPFSFLAREYISPRTLAHAFCGNVKAAQHALRTERVADWVQQSYGSRALSEKVIKLIGSPNVPGMNAGPIDDETVASIAATLDPGGPVRHRGLSIMLDGFGPALAFATLAGTKDRIQTIKYMLEVGLPLRSIDSNPDITAEQGRERTFRTLLTFARDVSQEAGIERCLYELNRTLPCLSPLVSYAHANTPQAVVKTLDILGRSSERPAHGAQDRHIAAFLSAQMTPIDRQKVTARLHRLNFPTTGTIADIALFASIQRRYDMGPLPGLTRWLSAGLDPTINAIHSRARRRTMRTAVDTATRSGDLTALMTALGNKDDLEADRREYRAAMQRYKLLDGQLNDLRSWRAQRRPLAIMHGRRVAFGIAVVVLLFACVSAIGGVGI